ncbi:MAG: S41 family peptidase, partial [Chloroflexota bacterium]
MQRKIVFIVVMSLLVWLAACTDDGTETAVSPTPSPEIISEAATASPTPIPATETAVAPTSTPLPTDTPTPAATATPAAQFPPAAIVNDEGGPVAITGVVTYTNPFFTLGVAAPVVILEDQAGFVDRDENYIMPVASQALGQITSDFYTSPFTYSLALPLEPQGAWRDVDNDEDSETGVQVFAIAYWTNTFGDPFLEERDLGGGGWSTAYASTVTSDDPEKEREISGGWLLVYALDDQQGFPSDFGEDGLLFSDDDPLITLPTGYTLVNLDTSPFTFDRSRHPHIDLLEPDSAALVDYSDLDYSDAFNALVDQLSNEYAFTEYKNIDWEALRAEFGPLFVTADATNDEDLYLRALRDFSWSIPDGHVAGPFLQDEFSYNAVGGIGMAVRELDDGRVIANFILEDGPAADAGIALGAEILALNGTPISEAISETIAYTAPFSTEHVRRLNQLIFVTRFPLNTPVAVTYQNPGSSNAATVALTAAFEQDSFYFALGDLVPTGFELPLEYELLDSGYTYVKVYSFSDNELLTIQLWERLMRNLQDEGVPGLIIDMRENGGGSGFLASSMAAYFFQETLPLGYTSYYDKERGEFYFDPDSMQEFILPPAELRYDGQLAVIVGPNCASACEFFSYYLTLQDRAAIVGHYPTAGLGGSIDQVAMPEGETFTFTQGRAMNADGEIHIEGKGVPPTVRVPVTATAVLGEDDVLLETAVAYLDQLFGGGAIDGGSIAIGDAISGDITPGLRIQYTLELATGDQVNIYLSGTTAAGEELDTMLYVYDSEGTELGNNDDLDADTLGSGFEDIEAPF